MKQEDFVDVKIIQLQEIYQNMTAEYDLLMDEIPIHRQKVRFRYVSLFDETFSMLLPENFTQMPDEAAIARYINNFRPPLIMSGPRFDENFGFHMLEGKKEELSNLIRQMKETVKRYVPETIFYEEGTVMPEDMEGRWFEYKNFTLDEETYNMQFLVQSDSKLLAGTFNCRMRFYEMWKSLVLQSLELIKHSEKGRVPDEGK